MPYKDPATQKAAQRRSYERNKAAVMERQRERRQQQAGARDAEYARRRGLSLSEYRERKAAGTLRPAPTRSPQARKAPAEAKPSERPVATTGTAAQRSREERAVDPDAQSLIDTQRRMKEAALRRLGLQPTTTEGGA